MRDLRKPYNKLGIFMLPPSQCVRTDTDFTINTRKLMLYNADIDAYIYVDTDKLDRVKHCKWYLHKNKVVNEHMIPIEEFLGIDKVHKRNTKYSRFDYRLVVYLDKSK